MKKYIRKGLLIILSGPSGVGKGTIRRLIMRKKFLNLAYSISMTTRPIRPHEVDGRDYFFVSHEQFQNNIKEEKFLEWAKFVGNYYGTPKDYVERLREEGKNVIVEIEVEGAKQVKNKYKTPDVISIFILPPSLESLKERIMLRKTETEQVMNARLEKASREILEKDQYDYNVLNDDVYKAAKDIQKIISDRINLLHKKK